MKKLTIYHIFITTEGSVPVSVVVWCTTFCVHSANLNSSCNLLEVMKKIFYTSVCAHTCMHPHTLNPVHLYLKFIMLMPVQLKNKETRKS